MSNVSSKLFAIMESSSIEECDIAEKLFMENYCLAMAQRKGINRKLSQYWYRKARSFATGRMFVSKDVYRTYHKIYTAMITDGIGDNQWMILCKRIARQMAAIRTDSFIIVKDNTDVQAK